MNLDLSEDQTIMRETFARFLNEQSSVTRMRAAMAKGHDAALWRGLAELGAFSIRVPAEAGGLDLTTLDGLILMEEVGRTLALGPIAETLVASRVLALLGGESFQTQLGDILEGRAIVSLALQDAGEEPRQWIAGGAVANAVIARRGDEILFLSLPPETSPPEPTLASTALTEVDLSRASAHPLAAGPEALAVFARALEEWKLLVAASLSGLSREAVRLAAAYATERLAFGQPIGAYQAISHPLADLITDIDAGKYLLWKVIWDISRGESNAAAAISLAAWWHADLAARTGRVALHTFGGYGLTTEYDIHLYNLRAKEWALVLGDPYLLLEEAGARLFGGAEVPVPEVGDLSIDFDLGQEAAAFAQEVDDFFDTTLTPDLRAKAHYSWDGHDAGVHKKLAEARLLFPSWPIEDGGRGANPYVVSAARHVWEKQGWTGHAANTTAMIGAIVRRFGSDEARRDVFDRIVSGEVICSLGFSEPGSGSDVFAAQCKATPDGNGWRIDGQKMFTSGADIADYVLLLTRTDPDAPKHKGLTMFIVPLKADGVSVQPVFTFQDERTNITYYDGVRIPDSYRLGDVNGGVKVMAASLELEHGGGGFGAVQDAMVNAAADLCGVIRRDGKPLIANGNVRARLARATVHAALSEVLSLRALWAAAERKPNPGFGPMSKLFSSEKFLSDAADLMDLTAPLSLSKRPGSAGFLNQCYRHAHGTTIYGGTSEVHRSMIAERNLGLPRSRL